jgi:hypothetical protein
MKVAIRIILVVVVAQLLICAGVGIYSSWQYRTDPPPTLWALTNSENNVTLTFVGTVNEQQVFRFTNSSGRAITWEGPGRSPGFRIRKRGYWAWFEVRQYLYCGDERRLRSLPAGQSVRFEIDDLPTADGLTMQVGVEYIDADGKQRTAWTQPFTVAAP